MQRILAIVQRTLRIHRSHWGRAWAFGVILLGAALGTSIPPARAAALDPSQRITVSADQGDPGGWFFGQRPPTNHVRRYFIAAEEVPWAFTIGSDPVCGAVVPRSSLPKPGARRLRYIQYTDGTFTTPVIQPRHLGILGPPLRGVVGDYLVVTFYNRTSRPLSMHPHGVKYDKDSEGAWYLPGPGRGAGVGPGAGFTYVWKLDEGSGPAPGEPSSKGWLYHSHVMGDEEINLGLAGFIVVTDPKRAGPDGTPADVDRELAALFMIFNEDDSPEEAREELSAVVESSTAMKQAAASQFAADALRREEGARHAINGLAYGALPGLEMVEGERVRWYLFALGAEQDLHTAHWHGLRATDAAGHRTDLVELLPGSMKSVDMVADNPGPWLFHCHVGDHMMEGMYAGTVVHPNRGSNIAERVRRERYYPAANTAASWQIDSATLVIPDDRNQATNCVLAVRGSHATSGRPTPAGTPVELRFGPVTAAVQLDQRGEGRATAIAFHSAGLTAERGASPPNLQPFQAELEGMELARAVQQLGLSTPERVVRSQTRFRLEMRVGRASHAAKVRVTRIEPIPGGKRLHLAPVSPPD